MPLPFFTASLASWRAAYTEMPGASLPEEAADAVVKLSIKAVEDARTKAEELAAAAGLTLGPVVSIAEGTLSPMPPPLYAAADAEMAKAEAVVLVQSGSSTIAVDVAMTFELR